MNGSNMSGGLLSRNYDRHSDGDRDDTIVISDDEDKERSKVVNSNSENLSSGRNSVNLSVPERGSSEEQLENSIQRAIKRTIKRFSYNSTPNSQDDDSENERKILDADNVLDHDDVFVNNYRKKCIDMDNSSEEELETIQENIKYATHRVESSKKIFDGERPSEESPKHLRRTLKRKKRVIYQTDSSDDDIPLKKTKSGLSDRSMSPEYELPRKENHDTLCHEYYNETYVNLNTTQEPVHYIAEAGGSKNQSPKLHDPILLDDSTEEEGILQNTKESASICLDSSDDEYTITTHSPRSQNGMTDSYSFAPDNYRHEDDSVSSEEASTSDDADDEDNLPEDYGDQRSFLLGKKRQIEKKLSTITMLLKTDNITSHSERAERLRLSIESGGQQLLKILGALTKLDLERKWKDLRYAPPKKRSLFKDNSFEMDPDYLTPKLSNFDKKLGKKAQATLNREQSLTVERLQDLHGSLVARPVENQKATDPRGLKVILMPHQQHALAWLQWREQQNPRGGVLADEMGLGKTLTMIALVMASIAKDNDGEGSENEEEWKLSARGQRHLGGTLVVVPASLLAQWEAEVKTRCKRDSLTVELYHGSKRETVPKRLAKNDIVITTYNIVCREFKMFGLLFKIRWRRVILDEAHIIRNYKSQPCHSVCGLYTNKRWAVTGTPLHNKEMDLYSILKFLQCSPFDDVRVWKRWVDNRNVAGHERLATVMKTLMLRRTKQELQAKGELPPLPDKSVQVIEVALDSEERLVYDKVMLYSRTLFAQFLTQRAEKNRRFEFGGTNYNRCSWNNSRDTQFTKAQNKLLSLHADVQAHEILVLLIRLRQVCCHPSLIKAMLDRDDIELQAGTDIDIFSKTNKINMEQEDDDDEEQDSDDFRVDERVVEHLLTAGNPVFHPKRQSSKMRAVIAKIEEVLDKGDKIIVVSQWVGVLNIVAMELDSIEDASYRMFTGQVAVKDRQGILDDFNSRSSDPNILLLSLTAGGVGLNVVGANHMLLVDIHWNPQLESQAQDRIHRFGQTKEVHIYKYICSDTIEERIQALQNKKLELARQVLSGTGKVVGSKLSLDDIKSLFGI